MSGADPRGARERAALFEAQNLIDEMRADLAAVARACPGEDDGDALAAILGAEVLAERSRLLARTAARIAGAVRARAGGELDGRPAPLDARVARDLRGAAREKVRSDARKARVVAELAAEHPEAADARTALWLMGADGARPTAREAMRRRRAGGEGGAA